MTATLKTETIGKHAVSIEIEKYSTVYAVRGFYERGGLWYTISENYYGDLRKAKKQYAALRRRYTKEEA